VGIVLYMFLKSDKKKNIGAILLGFAILMFGMDTMSGTLKDLGNEPWFSNIFLTFGKNPILGVLAGTVLTAIIQSSSASVGILQAMAGAGVVTFGSALPIILGQNIGTCATALISSVGTSKNARRTAIVHLYFNIIGMLLFLGGFLLIDWILKPEMFGEVIGESTVAVIHTVFNLTTTFLLLPFAGLLEKLAMKTIKEKKSGEPEIALLDERLLGTPSAAVNRARQVAVQMAQQSKNAFLAAVDLCENYSEEGLAAIKEQEDQTDKMEDALGTYLVKLSSCQLGPEENRTVNKLLHAIGDWERMADHAVNLAKTAKEMKEKDLRFSSEAEAELAVLDKAVKDLVERTEKAYRENDLALAETVYPEEQVIDLLVKELKARHIKRLQSGNCTITYGFVLDDYLTNCERVADHCSNVAVEMIQVSESRYDTHRYLGDVKDGKGEEGLRFKELYSTFKEDYRLPAETV
ncbi:MAG: Na/Pi cotransporter family protein, partial [Clostridia bacterium]|nr:Na/Pi cotransporter family protein [Clostridia bacterium]